MKRFFSGILLGCALLTSVTAWAMGPVETLETITKEMLSTINQNRPQLDKNPLLIISLVDKTLSPHVDFTDMAKWVAGRNAWSKATPEQQERFTNVFRELLMRTYAVSLNQYHDQKVQYFPLREGNEGKHRVQVLSKITSQAANPLNVAYRLVNDQDRWRVYDIVIEGVSLLKGFQSQFSDDIKHNGLDSATQKIREHLNKVKANG